MLTVNTDDDLSLAKSVFGCALSGELRREGAPTHASYEEIQRLPLHIKQVKGTRVLQKWKHLLFIGDRILHSTRHADAFLRVIKYARQQQQTALRQQPQRQAATMELSPADIEALRHAGLIRASRQTSLWRLRTFSVPETTKGRRRWIVHAAPPPRSPKKCPIALTDFALTTISEARKKAAHQYAACLDFKSYYHQFRLDEDGCAFGISGFGFQAGSQLFALSTIPTGANWCPALAQIYTHALALATTTITDAPAANAPIPSLAFDCYIDNVRFTGNDIQTVRNAVITFHNLCGRLAVDINEPEEEVIAAMESGNPYPFLGVTYHHGLHSVALTDKTAAKIRELPLTAEHCTLRQFMRAYGTLSFATQVLAIPRAPFYFATKFLRRKMAAVTKRITNGSRWEVELERQYILWPVAQREMAAWRSAILTQTWKQVQQPHQHTHSLGATLYTDASSTGLGAVMFAEDGAVAVYAQKFNANQSHYHINVKEAIALHSALIHMDRALRPYPWLDVRVDNTSLKFSIQKSHSSSFWLNAWVGRIVNLPVWVRVRSITYVRSSENHADLPSRSSVAGLFASHNPFLWGAFRRSTPSVVDTDDGASPGDLGF